MTINAMFIVDLIYALYPWTIVEYLFPMALIATLLLGLLVLRLNRQHFGKPQQTVAVPAE